jgi:hypothetical protein
MFPLSQSLLWRLTTPTCLFAVLDLASVCLIKESSRRSQHLDVSYYSDNFTLKNMNFADGDYNRYGRNVEIGGRGQGTIESLVVSFIMVRQYIVWWSFICESCSQTR